MDAENICMLIGETLGKAVIDTACPETCCGTVWFETYVSSLSSKDRNHLRCQKSSKKFRFGDGKTYCSLKKVTIPIFLNQDKLYLNVEVIECSVPLLISSKTLKRADAQIDIGKNIITFLGIEIPLIQSSSGHLCLPIARSTDSINVESKRTITALFTSPLEFYADEEDLKKKVTKLHKQFVHPQPSKLISLINDSGVSDPKVSAMVNVVTSNCEVCKRYKTKPLKPAVGFPLATQFNQTVALDLKQFGSRYVLHMVDHLSRYGSACLIPNKKKETIVQGILEYWVRIFGSPGNS